MGTKTTVHKCKGEILTRAWNPGFSHPPAWSTLTSINDSVVDSVITTLEVHGWRDEIRARRSATSNMTGVKYKLGNFGNDMFGATVHQAPSPPQYPNAIDYRYEMMGHFALISAPGEGALAGLLVKANNQALTYLNKSIQKKRQSIPGLVALGELGETLRMIRRPAESLMRGMFDYLGTVKKRAGQKKLPLKKKNSIVADTWLEYAFGWAPLIGDIKGAAEGLAKRASYMAEVEAVSGRGFAQDTTFWGNYSQINYGALKVIRNKIVNKSVAEVFYHGVVSNNPAHWNSGDATFGFTPNDFVPAVWELIPYSFLVDYFSNIGNIIEAFTRDTSGVRWLEKGTRTSSNNYLSDVRLVLSDLPYPRELYSYKGVVAKAASGPSTGYEIVRVSRQAWVTSLVPDLEFTIPGLSRKWLNMAALGATHRRTIRDIR
jgi:hypothetical protein